MAPSATTEDYYMILDVSQTAELEPITRSYRRLALKLHPDRNPRPGATQAFQQVRQTGTQYLHFVDEWISVLIQRSFCEPMGL